MRDIEEATDRVIAGPAKKSRVISEKERNIVAHHEAGHTIIGMVLDEAEVVHKVTIVPRGQAGGYAMMLPKQDRFLMTEPELLDKICGLLGGRVSEDINFNEVSTGSYLHVQQLMKLRLISFLNLHQRSQVFFEKLLLNLLFHQEVCF